jgi:2-polyprenyl-3-methyl-5-hydroxy-6-metoxy-1,4-benzoquinol methylase
MKAWPMLRKHIRRPLVRLIQRVLFPVPNHLARNQIQIGPQQVQIIRESIEANYYQGPRDRTHYGLSYEATVRKKLDVRLAGDRRLVVPWLDHARSLKGSRILEVGCGTGCSTVALAEQGAAVVGIDIDQDALIVARDRCRVYGIKAEFHGINANAMGTAFGHQQFDFVIFFAAIEHMMVAERLTALRDAWRLLPTGGLLVIVEAPNRLWFYDGHTSLLPFFHWLPDELAFQYARFSPRENFRERFTDFAEQQEDFVRTGRGMSFHEFDLAIGPTRDLNVVSSLSTFQGIRYKPQRSLFERRFKSELRRIYPGLHPGFYEDSLYLIIRKD